MNQKQNQFQKTKSLKEMTKTEWGGDIKNRIKYSTAILIQEWPLNP